MNVGFYYHVEAVFEPDGSARVPALLGIFIEELAKRAGTVTFYTHGQSRAGIEDYQLRPPLVRCVDLGPRPRFPQAMFVPGRWLRSFQLQADEIDVMLIRGPTPLLPHLVKAAGDTPVALHIVGDYASEDRYTAARSMPWWRDALIRLVFRLYRRRQREVSDGVLVLVNSPHLVDRFPGRDDVGVVIESTLMEGSLVAEPRRLRPGLGSTRSARLLMAGRIIPEKGLWEAAEAVLLLAERGIDAVLDIVGWQAPTDPVEQAFRRYVKKLGIEERVRYLGYVPAGEDLAEVYRSSDVFVLPSRSRAEGFPRTVLEAMGAGIPVVTTPVGGVPHWVRHKEEAILVEPSPSAVADGIEALLKDADLHDRVARGGWEFARNCTLEKGSEDLARRLAGWRRDSPSTMSSRRK